MTELHLVRHGETEWHAENRYAGSTDVPLTERGSEQARDLARWSSGADLDAIVSSDLSRAVRTAHPVAEATGLALRTDSRWREVDFGIGEGLTRAEMATRFGAELASFLAAPARVPLPGGEPGTRAIDRALRATGDLVELHPQGRILVVTHATLARLLLCVLLGVDPNLYRQVFPQLGNTAVNTVRLEADGTADNLAGRAGLVALNLSTGGSS